MTDRPDVLAELLEGGQKAAAQRNGR